MEFSSIVYPKSHDESVCGGSVGKCNNINMLFFCFSFFFFRLLCERWWDFNYSEIFRKYFWQRFCRFLPRVFQSDRNIFYQFIPSCTNCGPRFSVVLDDSEANNWRFINMSHRVFMFLMMNKKKLNKQISFIVAKLFRFSSLMLNMILIPIYLRDIHARPISHSRSKFDQFFYLL